MLGSFLSFGGRVVRLYVQTHFSHFCGEILEGFVLLLYFSLGGGSLPNSAQRPRGLSFLAVNHPTRLWFSVRVRGLGAAQAFQYCSSPGRQGSLGFHRSGPCDLSGTKTEL